MQTSEDLRPTPISGRTPETQHAEFLGLSFSLLSPPQVIRLIIDGCRGPYRYVVTPNAYHVVAVHDNPDVLLPVYRGAWLSLCDSQILRALAKLDGQSLPLITGSDLTATLLSGLNFRARTDAPKLLVVGPDPSIAGSLRQAYPNLAINVLSAPAGLARSADLRRAVARSCMAEHWDILLLCMGCPAQELIASQVGELGRKSGTALCVGAAIDFIAGTRPRSPIWVQKFGLEWAYRLVREPGRLWRRYLIESPKIFRIYIATRSVRKSSTR